MSNLPGFPRTDEEKAAHHARNLSQGIRGILAWLNPQAPTLDDMEALNLIYAEIEKMKAPPFVEGQLRRQSNGRWLLSQAGDLELTSGSCLEVWTGNAWTATRIEHSRERGGYYRIDGGPLLDGDHVRVPRLPR
jgi:hypothetical protein